MGIFGETPVTRLIIPRMNINLVTGVFAWHASTKNTTSYIRVKDSLTSEAGSR